MKLIACVNVCVCNALTLTTKLIVVVAVVVIIRHSNNNWIHTDTLIGEDIYYYYYIYIYIAMWYMITGGHTETVDILIVVYSILNCIILIVENIFIYI